MIEDLPGEEWRDIAGHEGRYRVSNKGRVMTLVRRKHAILAANGNTKGYPQVDLKSGGPRKVRLVHRIVMETFNPIENSDAWEVNHIDFNKKNPAVENLEWSTRRHNVDHFLDSGRGYDKTNITGERHHLCMLTEANVLEIRNLYAGGMRNMNALARQFGINGGTVKQIVSGKTWRHLLPGI